MNMIEAIRARVSTRSFDGKKLSAVEAKELEAMLARVAREGEHSPFGKGVRLALYEGEGGETRARMGTYGLISGASAFIVPAVRKGPGSMEDAGWVVEKAVLEATAMGYATCWIGGVFNRSKAAEVVGAGGDEIVPAVIALGRPAERRSIADKIVAGRAQSRSRKPLESVVYVLDGDSLKEPWTEIATAVQIAPSASNKQPWRLLRLSSGSDWLIFLDEDRAYNNSLGEVHLQNLDIGIAMRHFSEAAQALGVGGKWTPVTAAGNAPDAEAGGGTDGRAGIDDILQKALQFGSEKGWIAIARWQHS